MKTNLYIHTPLLLVLLFLAGCTAPRNIVASGKVTPKGAFKAGFNSSFNISTAPMAELEDITLSVVKAIDANSDSIFYNETVRTLGRGLMAYSLDPVTPTSDFYLRYGIAKRVDIGYKFASGAHVIDAMYQFLGTTGTPDHPGEGKGLHGSIGIQYSGQKSDLPKKLGLNYLSGLFNYDLQRRDILIPLVFSSSFGPEETYGTFSFGLVYGHSFIKYGYNPSKTFVRSNGSEYIEIPSFSHKEDFSSFGLLMNVKVGYKFAYFVPALNMYWQDYGNYDLFGIQQERFRGMTFIPSLGLQLNLGYERGKKKAQKSA